MISHLIKQKKFIYLFSFILIMLGSQTLLGIDPGKEKTRDLGPYTTKALEGRLSSTISASGELQAEKSLNISPHRQGLINEIYVKEGDLVLRNQLIAKIESRDFPYRLNEIQTEFENKKDAYERRKYLFQEGAISEETYKQFRNDFLKSKAKLDQIQVEGEELFIRAPFKGIITAKFAEPGSFVSPNSQGSNISSTKTSVVEISQGLEVLAKVPESEIGRIEIGQQGIVQVEAFPEERFESTVSYISPRALKNNNVTSFEVKLKLINPPTKLRIGMTSDVEFQSGESNLQILVPTVSIVTREGEPGVLTVGEKSKPIFQAVELGSSSGSKTVILSGIKSGDVIFIDIPPWTKGRQQ